MALGKETAIESVPVLSSVAPDAWAKVSPGWTFGAVPNVCHYRIAAVSYGNVDGVAGVIG